MDAAIQAELSKDFKYILRRRRICWWMVEGDQRKSKQSTARVRLDNYRGTFVLKNGSLKMRTHELNDLNVQLLLTRKECVRCNLNYVPTVQTITGIMYITSIA